MVMVGYVVMTMISRLPMLALLGVPGRMIGFHGKLTGAMGQGREKRREGKRKKQHECCAPSHNDSTDAHLPSQHVPEYCSFFVPLGDSRPSMTETHCDASHPTTSCT